MGAGTDAFRTSGDDPTTCRWESSDKELAVSDDQVCNEPQHSSNMIMMDTGAMMCHGLTAISNAKSSSALDSRSVECVE
ncbi:hypothetical protein AKJ16_DCAP06847 [Drosera capensis]